MLLNKKGSSDTAIWVAVAIIAMIAISQYNIFGLGSTFSGKKDGGTPAEDLTEVIKAQCSDPSNTFTFGPLYAKWGSQITSGENIHWWKNGISQGTKAVGSTETLNNGDKLAFVAGIDSSTYYANYFEAEMPCGPTDLASLSKEAGDGAHELITADVDYVVQLFNSDTGLLNADGTNETIGSGQEGKWNVKVQGDSEQGIGPNGNLLFIVGMEKNNFSASDTTLGGKSADAQLPSWFTTANTMVYKTFTIAGCPTGGVKMCDLNLGTLVVKAKDSVDPYGAGDNKGNFLNITIANSDYDIDTNSNLILGSGKPVFEDNTGTTSGFATDGLTVYIQ